MQPLKLNGDLFINIYFTFYNYNGNKTIYTRVSFTGYFMQYKSPPQLTGRANSFRIY